MPVPARPRLLALLAGLAAALPGVASPPVHPDPAPPPAVPTPARARPVVQIAILLDTSNSMDGLIDQARAQLWELVGDFGSAHRDGARPELRVALYEYGNNRLEPSSGYLRCVLPFTTDLDLVSDRLFGLRTCGGHEFCGQAIRAAVGELAWSEGPADLRVLVLAGNEPVTQGGVDYRAAVTGARARGIIVDTIYCGPADSGEAQGWRDAAALGSGRFASINQDADPRPCATPFDARLLELGTALNETYLAYGTRRDEGPARQAAQDAQAETLGHAVAAQRAAAKASAPYDNAEWDLVDACAAGRVDLDGAPPEALPAPMQAMSAVERRAFVEQARAQREALKREIAALDARRREFLEQAPRAGSPTLGSGLRAMLRDQATALGYRFDAPSP